MTGMQLRKARKRKGWGQQQAATRLGVSQPYLSLLENGRRPLTRRLVARATRVLGLPLTLLPLNPAGSQPLTLQQLAEQLSALGYPGLLTRAQEGDVIQLRFWLRHSNKRT